MRLSLYNKKNQWLMVTLGTLMLTAFAVFVLFLQLRNSFRDFYLGPYGDEGQFINSIVNVSFGVDLWHELIKFEADYRLVVMKLIWAGNYIFTKSSLFTSAIVVLFLAIYTTVLAWMLYKDTLLTRTSKSIIFSAFLLANFGGFASQSLTVPVFATWPIVYSSLFTGCFFLICAVKASTTGSKLKTLSFLLLAHFFGLIALCTFGHAFIYFIFYAITLWVYGINMKRILLYCSPGMVLTGLYLIKYHSGRDAIKRLAPQHDVLLNLFAYYCRALSDALFCFTPNFLILAAAGLIGLIFLLIQLRQVLIKNACSTSGNALYAILSGIGTFAGLGLMLGIFARFDEMQRAAPFLPSRLDIQIDTLWACACGLALLRVSYLQRFYAPVKKITKLPLIALILISLLFLVLRQFEFNALAPFNDYFTNTLHVEQALGIHNGYLSRVGDPAQWIWYDQAEPAMRRRGMGGFAIKERFLTGLYIGSDLPVLTAAQCQISDEIAPGITTYDHLTDPGFYVDGVLKQSASAIPLSSVILIANSDNKVTGFGYRAAESRDRWGRRLGTSSYYALAPWSNGEYRTYALTQDRSSVCLLNSQVPVPQHDSSPLTRAIAPLHYTGKENQYLIFPDQRMQKLPHFLGLFYAAKDLITHDNDELVPFDARITTKIAVAPNTNKGGLAFEISPDLAERLKGHKVKIKLLVKQPADQAASTSAFRFDAGKERNFFSFSATKKWQVIEKTLVITNHEETQTFFRIWGDTSGQNKALLFRAAMIEVLGNTG